MISEKFFAVCAACGLNRQTKQSSSGKLLPPRGWKRRDGEDGDVFTCPACWRSLYRLRAITIPVQGVQCGGTWAEFCLAVRQSLLRSRTLAQWTINKLAATDVVRGFGDDKMPPHPPLGHANRVYLYGIGPEYPEWFQWAGNYRSAECVMRLMEAKYNAKRSGIIWEANSSIPTIRSCPYPIAAQNSHELRRTRQRGDRADYESTGGYICAGRPPLDVAAAGRHPARSATERLPIHRHGRRRTMRDAGLSQEVPRKPQPQRRQRLPRRTQRAVGHCCKAGSVAPERKPATKAQGAAERAFQQTGYAGCRPSRFRAPVDTQSVGHPAPCTCARGTIAANFRRHKM